MIYGILLIKVHKENIVRSGKLIIDIYATVLYLSRKLTGTDYWRGTCKIIENNQAGARTFGVISDIRNRWNDDYYTPI